jgi:hypothetical protein
VVKRSTPDLATPPNSCERRGPHAGLALSIDGERTCASGPDNVPVDFMRSLRWKQFTDLWVAEHRRQLGGEDQ